MNQVDILGYAGFAVALLGLALGLTRRARGEQRAAASASSAERFRQARDYQASRSSQLYKAALLEFDVHRLPLDLPLLGQEGWIPDRPIPLQDVVLTWSDSPAPPLDRAEKQARRLLPRDLDGAPVSDYVTAVQAFAAPGHAYFNGASYRLLCVSPGPPLTLHFAAGRYFDALNTTEVLGFEAAGLHRAGKRITGDYRNKLSSPFSFEERSALPGISVVTVRAGSPATVVLHHRSSSTVGVARNSFHVAPAGEFQPADVSLEAMSRDFDLWRSIVREFAEEFLGHEDARGRAGAHLDYDRTPPFAELQLARAQGQLRVHVLGIGLDPLTWKPEILAVAVFDPDCFDRLFAGIRSANDEGLLILGDGGQGVAFTEETVLRYSIDNGTLAAGNAALQLAWTHRVELGIADR